MRDARKTYYDMRRMGHMEMYRGRWVRMIRELEAIEYGDVSAALVWCCEDLKAVGRELGSL